MSLSAQDIVALARAGFNAEQISVLNREAAVSTPSTPSTPSIPSTELSTLSTEEPVQEKQAAPAVNTVDQPAAAQDPAPAVQETPRPAAAAPQVTDLMAKLEELQQRITGMHINSDQQPGQEDQLTGEKVLAQILDPRIK